MEKEEEGIHFVMNKYSGGETYSISLRAKRETTEEKRSAVLFGESEKG